MFTPFKIAKILCCENTLKIMLWCAKCKVLYEHNHCKDNSEAIIIIVNNENNKNVYNYHVMK